MLVRGARTLRAGCFSSTNAVARAFPTTAQAGVSVVLARRRRQARGGGTYGACDDYALIQRGNPPNALAWSFPGGRVELGNTMLETAQLELEEETGISRDRVLWHADAIGSHDVIVREEDHGNDKIDDTGTGGEETRVQYHYTVAQIYGELLGCHDSSEDDGKLVAGDDALNARWWRPYPDENNYNEVDVSARTMATLARVEALRSAELLDCVAATLPAPPSADTSSSSPVALTEIKQKLDGSAQEFVLECWEWDSSSVDDEIVVGRWCAPPGGQFGMPEGSYSWGVWGQGVFGDVAVGAYRMHGPDGRLSGYRFDCIGRVEMEVHPANLQEADGVGNGEEENISLQRTLVFHDLLLDALVGPGPEYAVRLEDEDEVEEWTKSGKLSEAQLRTIESVRQVFSSEKHDGVACLASKVDAAIARTVGRVRAGEAVL